MKSLHLDIETYSEVDLRAAGVYRYAEHPSTEILCFSYAFDDGPVQDWQPGQPVPLDVIEHVRNKGEFRAHNAQFERVVLNGVAGQKIGFPRIAIRQCICTAAKMAASGLPRGLDDAAAQLGGIRKDEGGRITMLQLSKPRRGKETRYTPENAPEKFAILYEYCHTDVEAERSIDHLVPDLSPAEQEIYWLDQVINDRGVLVDVDTVATIQTLVRGYKAQLEQEMIKLTGFKPSQREKIADWVRGKGVELLDLQATTVAAAVKEDIPPDVRRALIVYSTFNAKATSKFDAIEDAVCADNKLHGMFTYHGAGTGRWTSTIVQLHNLARPVIEDPEAALDVIQQGDLDWLRMNYPKIDPLKVIASCVRPVLVAPEGKTLVFPDYSGIEARYCMWLFGEEWKLEVFRKQDAKTGPDSYVSTYARLFGVEPEDVNKHQRQIGKVCLAADTLVYCRQGLKRIDEVTTEDEVWDGIEWVSHRGSVCNGSKNVLNLCGVWLTPDHQILCGQTWYEAQYLVVSPELTSLALATGAENLPSQDSSWGQKEVSFASLSGVDAEHQNTELKHITLRTVNQSGAISAPKISSVKNAGGNTQPPVPMTPIGPGCLVVSGQPLHAVPAQMTVRGRITGGAESVSAPNGATTAQHFFAMCARFLAGTIRDWTLTASTLIKGTNRGMCGSSPEKKTTGIGAKSNLSSKKMLVYDLLSVGSRNRFAIWSPRGPLMVHNCDLAMQYEGGVGAFVTMAGTYRLNLNELKDAAFHKLDEDSRESAEWMWGRYGRSSGLDHDIYVTCDGLKHMWRKAHAKVKQGWKDVREAAELAVQNPGKVYAVAGGRIRFKMGEYRGHNWLCLRLPSGRVLRYFNPRWIEGTTLRTDTGFEGEFIEEHTPGELRYWGVDTDTRQYCETSSYGGKWVENATQGGCADILRRALVDMNIAGYHPIGHVHDEPIGEVGDGFEEHGRLTELLCRPLDWAPGLPLNIEMNINRRYKK